MNPTKRCIVDKDRSNINNKIYVYSVVSILLVGYFAIMYSLFNVKSSKLMFFLIANIFSIMIPGVALVRLLHIKTTLDYVNTYIRSITEENPEVYYSSNIVSDDDISYEEWSDSGSIPRNQVYISGTSFKVDENQIIEDYTSMVVDEKQLYIKNKAGKQKIEYDFPRAGENIGHLRMFFNGTSNSSVSLCIQFMDTDGNSPEYEELYQLKTSDANNNIKYVDVYMPNASKSYSEIDVLSSSAPVSKASYVQTDRMTKDDYTDVSYFGFNSIRVNVDAPTDGVVTVLQNKHPGWRAYVDGNKVDVMLVNGALMGVGLAAGSHEVEFLFRPTELYIGILLTVAFYIFYMIILIMEQKEKRGKMHSFDTSEG